MRSLISRWPTELLLPILVAGLEAAAISPLIHLVATRLFFRHPMSTPWPVAIAALGLLAFWSTRVCSAHLKSLGLQRMLSFVLWLTALAAWLAWQYEVWGDAVHNGLLGWGHRYLAVPAILSLLAWWRGLSYASMPEPFTSDNVRHAVRIAWVALVLELIVAAMIDSPAATDALESGRLAVPTAVICGLLALAVAQIEQAQRSALRRKGRKPERRTWVLIAGGATLFIMVMSMIVSGLLGSDVWSVLYEPVAFVLHGLSMALLYLVLILAFLVFLLLSPLLWLLRYVINGSEPTEPATSDPLSFSQFAHDTQSQMAPNLLLGLRWALIAVAVPLMIFIVLRTLRRYQNFEREEEIDEERESLWSRDMVEGQLRGLFGRRGPRSVSKAPLDLTLEPSTVRESYRFLTVLAARHGDPRSVAETPATFSGRLRDAWPDVDPQIADLTERYLRVRYGDLPDEPERDEAKVDWQTILAKHPPVDDGE